MECTLNAVTWSLCCTLLFATICMAVFFCVYSLASIRNNCDRCRLDACNSQTQPNTYNKYIKTSKQNTFSGVQSEEN